MAATEEIEKEILAEMAANPVPYAAGQVNDVITIDGETRMISVPASEIFFGVESDKDVERKHFRCPKVVGDGIDLSKHQIYISYITSDSAGKTFSGNAGLYLCEDVATDGDDITFSWQLSGNVFASAGFIAFKVLAAKTDGENVQTRWNTVPAIGTVLMTVPDGMDIGEAYPDIVTQLLERMASVEKIATEEAMQGYVNTYLEAHPGEIDETLTDPKKAAPASVVGELKEDLGDFFTKTESVNKFDKFSVEENAFYKNVNGTVTKASVTGYVAFLLPVKGGKTYTVSGTSYSVLTVGNNMEYLGYAWKSGEITFNTDLMARKTELKYLAISFRTSSYPVDTYMAVEGDTLPEEYVSYSVHKEIKEDVEIDYSQIINKPNHEKKYCVGAGKEYTSFTECIKSLPDDELDKIIYVDGGVYDIFEEIGGAEYAQSIPESSEDLWRQYNTIIPSNTKIIGIGEVIFNFTPTSDQMTATSARYLSPLNVSGNVEIENITINADNCRYCIHDETSGIADFTGSVHKYKNVHLNKKRTSMGMDCAFGCGFNASEVFEFDGCVFESNDRALSFHNRGADVDGTIITIKDSALIKNKNGTQRSLRFGNVNSKQVHISVNVFNTYINGLIKIQNESSEKPNAFDISLFNCGEKEVVVECATNIYIPKIYKSN